MTSLEFIQDRLKSLVIKFPVLKCLYIYDELICSHLVEIKPEELYQSDSDILAVEMSILKDFIDAFPQETLTFIDENDILKVDYPSFIIIGDLYENSSLISSFESVTVFLPNNQGSLLTYELEPVILSSIELESSIVISNDHQIAMAA